MVSQVPDLGQIRRPAQMELPAVLMALLPTTPSEGLAGVDARGLVEAIRAVLVEELESRGLARTEVPQPVGESAG